MPSNPESSRPVRAPLPPPAYTGSAPGASSSVQKTWKDSIWKEKRITTEDSEQKRIPLCLWDSVVRWFFAPKTKGVPKDALKARYNSLRPRHSQLRLGFPAHVGTDTLLQARPIPNPHRRAHQPFLRRLQQLPQRLHAVEQSLPRIRCHDQMISVREQ